MLGICVHQPLLFLLTPTVPPVTYNYIDGEVLYSQEGTTQGDPLAMPFYALATVPLIKKLSSPTWYADDGAATGTTANLRSWWDEISTIGPSFGYFDNATKTWLVVKPEHLSEAVAAFANTNVNVTSEGRPYLGAAIGSSKYVHEFVERKVDQCMGRRVEATVYYCYLPATCCLCGFHPRHEYEVVISFSDCPRHWMLSPSTRGHHQDCFHSKSYWTLTTK